MLKPKKLMPGDTIAIVSLSSGILGEDFISHELKIAQQRLENYGFQVKYMPNSLKGMAFIQNHPEKRAEDLLEAFYDSNIKAIICAIGGDDTYRLAPYLFSDDKLKIAVQKNPKIFLGFSDTTVNHFMLFQCGLVTFYGQSFLPDLAELDHELLPYSRHYFEALFLNGNISLIEPSDIWYEERVQFDQSQIGLPRIVHKEMYGWKQLQGNGTFSGEILGGCLESIYELLEAERYKDQAEIAKKYHLFPSIDQWKNKILLLETSEEKATPEKFEIMLRRLEKTGILEVIKGVLVGKPMDETYYDEYKEILLKVFGNRNLPIVYNLNIGHATPRCILPFSVSVTVDVKKSKIIISESVFDM